MGKSAKAAIEAEAANEVQSWLECPAIREEFRRHVQAWEEVERRQSEVDAESERSARLEQRPFVEGEFPLHVDSYGVPRGVSTARLSNRFDSSAESRLAADAMTPAPRPGVSSDITHSLAPWSTSSAFVLLAVLHDRAAIERAGRWQPIMTESDHWPAFAVRVLIVELLIDDAPLSTETDEAFDAGDIRSALSTVREELATKGLLPDAEATESAESRNHSPAHELEQTYSPADIRTELGCSDSCVRNFGAKAGVPPLSKRGQRYTSGQRMQILGVAARSSDTTISGKARRAIGSNQGESFPQAHK